MSQSLAASSVAAPAALVSHAQSAVGSSAEHLVLQLLYQLIVILLVTRGVVWLSKRFLGQTAVAGEILAGLVLGPSVLGKFFPGVMHAVFVPETSAIFVGIAQVGLILLMFQIGMEFDFKVQLRQGRSAIAVISIVGVAVPFSLGFFTAPWLWETLAEPRPDLHAFRLFFATTISITAIPILGRIFMELGLSHTRTAALTIGSAAIDDIFGWLLLGAVSTMVISRFDPARFALHALLVFAYVGAVLWVVRPAMRYWLSRVLVAEQRLNTGVIGGILLVLLVSASITSNLGIFAIIGGFVIGVALHDNRHFVAQWNERVGGFVHVFFIPVFFAYTGLRTDVGSLQTLHDWVVCGLVCLLAFVAKFGGTYIASRIMGESRRSAAAIGVSMNTRALMELIALNIGYDLGVLPRQTFTMLVIMAIASTFIATPLIRRLMQDQRLAVDARSSTAPMVETIAR
ncbi:MAG: cation:proton antiporter [Burkholderia sp.]|jgi:Kef-type K+ transport system membrane component KefB|uniref:cation:proton antiporter n=1 Tax=Burkholderia sp. TaxID=36773 RepID=UPI00282227C5|nr:cation:proton antiporter [Burkholderia sp.]MDR0240660.1 cation:proton antiporter [Burkholderia sp.]